MMTFEEVTSLTYLTRPLINPGNAMSIEIRSTTAEAIRCWYGSNPAEHDGFFLGTSPPGGSLSRRSRVWDFRLVKKTQA